MRVITFSRYFPKKHPREGQPTGFIEKIFHSIYKDKPSMFFDAKIGNIWLDPYVLGVKNHTIRHGNRWKVGDKFSARYWKGMPYRSAQSEFAQIEIKKIFNFQILKEGYFLNGKQIGYDKLKEIAKNDGLSVDDFELWFAIHPSVKNNNFAGQILCWNENINY